MRTKAEAAAYVRERAEHPDRLKAQGRSTYARLKAEIKARSLARRAADPQGYRERKLAGKHRRRARKVGSYTTLDVGALMCAQDGCCYYCGRALTEYHIDHMLPVSRGGTNWPDNLVLACPPCNLQKSRMTADEYIRFRAAAQAA